MRSPGSSRDSTSSATVFPPGGACRSSQKTCCGDIGRDHAAVGRACRRASHGTWRFLRLTGLGSSSKRAPRTALQTPSHRSEVDSDKVNDGSGACTAEAISGQVSEMNPICGLAGRAPVLAPYLIVHASRVQPHGPPNGRERKQISQTTFSPDIRNKCVGLSMEEA